MTPRELTPSDGSPSHPVEERRAPIRSSVSDFLPKLSAGALIMWGKGTEAIHSGMQAGHRRSHQAMSSLGGTVA